MTNPARPMWPIRFIADEDLTKDRYGFVPVGALWAMPHMRHLGDHYLRDWKGKRMPLRIMLPDGTRFDIDGQFWKDGKHYGQGWKVTGEVPVISLAPSIHIVGSYHGYIRQGWITSDIDGLEYPNARGFPDD